MKNKKDMFETSEMGEQAAQELRDRNVQLSIANDREIKYDKKTFLRVYKGYDFLENYGVIRNYIRRKYNIDTYLLDILLYLAPKQFYTKNDLMKYPRDFRYIKVESLVKTGFFKTVIDHRFVTYKVYGVSARGRKLIEDFYECLSGEKEIKFDRYCPFTPNERDLTTYDKKRVSILKETYSNPISPTKEALFKKN